MLKFMNARNTGSLSFCDVVQEKEQNCYPYLLGCGSRDNVVGRGKGKGCGSYSTAALRHIVLLPE